METECLETSVKSKVRTFWDRQPLCLHTLKEICTFPTSFPTCAETVISPFRSWIKLLSSDHVKDWYLTFCMLRRRFVGLRWQSYFPSDSYPASYVLSADRFGQLKDCQCSFEAWLWYHDWCCSPQSGQCFHTISRNSWTSFLDSVGGSSHVIWTITGIV